MICKIFLVIALVVVEVAFGNEELVDEYEKLIKEGIQRSSTYQFPKDAREFEPENTESEDFGIFDFVVIGAGSAGAVAASRLSEIKEWNILLLEAGKDESNFTEIPAMSRHLQNSEYNWGFNSTPQKTCCLAVADGVCPFPRGKSLGGSSAINSLVYSRGNKVDYVKWAEEWAPGWAFKDIFSFFLKSENSHINGDEYYHGFDGPLNVNYYNPIDEKANIFLEANEELGLPILDYNGENQLGSSWTQFNTAKGKRDSTNRAFLKPARKRRNLKILTESYVIKILISDVTKTAYGVIFSHKNIKYVVKVRKEVILSAGVVGSPKILMLSGIGPKNHLISHGINVIKDLAVGEDLHDHTLFYNILFQTSGRYRSSNLRESVRQYLNGTGPLTISEDTEAISFFHLGLTNSSAPDFEIIFIPKVDLENFNGIHGNFDSVYKEIQETIRVTNNGVSQLNVIQLHPKSRGRVYLKSSDPFEHPLIESACLDDPENEDIENLYKGIKATLKLLETDAFKQLNPNLFSYAPCRHHPIFSKAYWICNIRDTTMNAFHGAGTCKMGQNPSKGAVVDYRLKVHGIKNLRVADTSVVPVTLSAHMNAPAIMIGERLADFIKGDYGKPKWSPKLE